MENRLRTTDETAGPGGNLNQAAIHASGMDRHLKKTRERAARFVRRRGRQVGRRPGAWIGGNMTCFSCSTHCAGHPDGLK